MLSKLRNFTVSLAQRWRNPKTQLRSEQLRQSEDRPSLCFQIGEFEGLGLIFEYPSGVYYTNQTGGYACHHPVQEGAFIVLDNSRGLNYKLEDYFTADKWGGHCYSGIDVETADFIDDFLEGIYDLLRVDRSRLAECEEAWIFVIVQRDEEPHYPEWSIGGRGVLTWNNSD